MNLPLAATVLFEADRSPNRSHPVRGGYSTGRVTLHAGERVTQSVTCRRTPQREKIPCYMHGYLQPRTAGRPSQWVLDTKLESRNSRLSSGCCWDTGWLRDGVIYSGDSLSTIRPLGRKQHGHWREADEQKANKSLGIATRIERWHEWMGGRSRKLTLVIKPLAFFKKPPENPFLENENW